MSAAETVGVGAISGFGAGIVAGIGLLLGEGRLPLWAQRSDRYWSMLAAGPVVGAAAAGLYLDPRPWTNRGVAVDAAGGTALALGALRVGAAVRAQPAVRTVLQDGGELSVRDATLLRDAGIRLSRPIGASQRLALRGAVMEQLYPRIYRDVETSPLRHLANGRPLRALRSTVMNDGWSDRALQTAVGRQLALTIPRRRMRPLTAEQATDLRTRADEIQSMAQNGGGPTDQLRRASIGLDVAVGAAATRMGTRDALRIARSTHVAATRTARRIEGVSLPPPGYGSYPDFREVGAAVENTRLLAAIGAPEAREAAVGVEAAATRDADALSW